MSAFFRLRRYRVLVLFTIFVVALFYHFSPVSQDSAYKPSDSWLHPEHDRGTIREHSAAANDPSSGWSDHSEEDPFPPPKDHPAAKAARPTPIVAPNDNVGLAAGSAKSKLAFQPVAGKATPTPFITDADTEDGLAPQIPKKPIDPHPELHLKKPPVEVHEIEQLDFEDARKKAAEAAALHRNSAIHWTKMPEHFPVPTESMIQLPTGKPLALPRIQYKFGSESSKAREERHTRQAAVKDAFRHAWEGYRSFAWGHDEVRPVSKSYKDPFAGWAATLVDGLDTMAIMGLHKEFNEALSEVENIDFTTTIRDNIPVFETTIRYLGGLIGAYDITGQKHEILIQKAVELADILYNAFDTPNRMPVLYFEWQPASVNRTHRASERSCMSELGSLTVEFTRLAQITGNHTYFDAVQRITDEFDEFSNKTSLPGFYPQVIDASGCDWVDQVYTTTLTKYPTPTPKPKKKKKVKPFRSSPGADEDEGSENFSPVDAAVAAKVAKGNREASIPKIKQKTVSEEDSEEEKDISSGDLRKRGEDDTPLPATPTRVKAKTLELELAELEEKTNRTPVSDDDDDPNIEYIDDDEPDEEIKPIITTKTFTKKKCAPTGLVLPPGQAMYSYGGMADSTYEYLLKEHILLGGLSKQYGRLYEQTYDVAREKFFFRPMTPKNTDILVSGAVKVTENYDTHEFAEQFDSEGSHLTCFVGGMVGMASKIMKKPEDLALAIKLTEGCVWNYFSTVTGIMPENFHMIACDKKSDCKWDKYYWYSLLIAPGPDAIASAAERDIKITNPYASRWKRDVGYDGGASKGAPKKPLGSAGQALNIEHPSENAQVGGTVPGNTGGKEKPFGDTPSKTVDTPGDSEPAAPAPPPPPSVDPFEAWIKQVESHLEYQKIPEGYATVENPKYILRPEAIESVFYMYRITGDKEWQDKGWKMFQAVENYTKTEVAHSAIENVLDTNTRQSDSMESFWLAETLKYFYLLFSEPDLVSLDEYVLNTEAHPLLRPKP